MIFKKVLKLMLIVFLICIAVYIIWQTCQQWNPALHGSSETSREVFSVSLDDGALENVKEDQVIAWRLFGKLNDRSVNGVLLGDIPESDLRMELRGVFYINNDALATAIIEKPKGYMGLYRLGDEVFDGVKVEKIYHDKVIVDKEGRLEVVYMNNDKNYKNQLPEMHEGLLPQKVASAKRITLKDDGFYKIVDEGLKPISEGKEMGYEANEDIGSSYRRLGIRPGDKILSINGYPLGSSESDALAIRSFYESGSASIVIVREGKSITIENSIR